MRSTSTTMIARRASATGWKPSKPARWCSSSKRGSPARIDRFATATAVNAACRQVAPSSAPRSWS